MVDDLQGERVDIEDVDNSKLAEMDTEYREYINDPKAAAYWGADYMGMVADNWDLITEEIGYRRRDEVWEAAQWTASYGESRTIVVGPK
jgi:hypothetical protein